MAPKRKHDVNSTPQTPHKRRITTITELFYELPADDLDHLNNRIEDVFTEEALSISRIRKTLKLRSDAPLDELKRLVRDAFDEASDALEVVDGSEPKVAALMKEVRKEVGMIERSNDPIAWKDMLSCLWRLAETRADGQGEVEMEDSPESARASARESSAMMQTESEGSSDVDTPLPACSTDTLPGSEHTPAESSADIEMKTDSDPADSPLGSQCTETALCSHIGSDDIALGIHSTPAPYPHGVEHLSEAESQSSSHTIEPNTNTDTEHENTLLLMANGATDHAEKGQQKYPTDHISTANKPSNSVTPCGSRPGPTIPDTLKTTAEARASRESIVTDHNEDYQQEQRVLKLKNGLASHV